MATLRQSSLMVFMRRHQVWTYFVLTFAISWGAFVILVGPTRLTPDNASTPFITVYLATVAGPSIAGALLTYLFDGTAGLRLLRSRLLTWRVGARWYAVALLTAPLTMTVTIFALSRVSPAFLPAIAVSMVPFALVGGLMNGLLEELGWTGFAVPKLRLQYSMLSTGLIVGFLWGTWHGLSNYVGITSFSRGFPLALYLTVGLFSFLPPYRVLMTWVYDHTQSLFVAVLMHAGADFVAILLIFTPVAISGATRVTWYLVWAALLWVAVAGVMVASSRRRTRDEYVSAIPSMDGVKKPAIPA